MKWMMVVSNEMRSFSRTLSASLRKMRRLVRTVVMPRIISNPRVSAVLELLEKVMRSVSCFLFFCIVFIVAC